MEIGGGGFIPGFSEQLEGMKPGEARTIEVTFPAEYGVPNLGGKGRDFRSYRQRAEPSAVVPAADEELAKKFGFEDFAAMRDIVTQRIQAEYDQMARLRLKRQLLDALADVVKFASPEGMVDQEFAQIWQRLEADRKEGRLDEDDKDEGRGDAEGGLSRYRESRVRLGLLLAEIGRVNSITVGRTR